MSDRQTELDQLAEELQAHPAVDDAFLAKSFTDRQMIIDVTDGDAVPPDIAERLANHDLRPADDVYGDDEDTSFAGNVGNATRYHFVDVQTRGSHRSYVID